MRVDLFWLTPFFMSEESESLPSVHIHNIYEKLHVRCRTEAVIRYNANRSAVP